MHRRAAGDRPRVYRVAVPGRVVEARLLDTVDYADAFWIAREVRNLEELTAFSRAVFGVRPVWLRALFRLRSWLVSPFGLRTSGSPSPEPGTHPPRIGDRVGLFTVMGLADDEIVLGEDDRHLDFRVSLLRRETEGRTGMVITTVVHIHNLLGRVYFTVVKPFHRLIVPAVMRRGVDALEASPPSSR